MNSRTPLILGLALGGSLLLAGCGAAPSIIGPTLHPLGSLSAGFYDAAAPPAPEGTLSPTAGSWDSAHPPAGYRVVLLTYGTDAQTTTLVNAVESWAVDEKVSLQTVVAASAAQLLDATQDAIDRKADLVITAGNALVDPLAALSPSVLSQQFLVLGAEIAEPTSNVTAADWTGAGFRGEGLGTPSHYDPASFTDERAGRALRAGIAAVTNHLNGIVVWVD